MIEPTGNVLFWSGKNYLKRDPSSGSASIAAPVTSQFGGTVYTTQFSVNHNLGYPPLFRVYYEPFGDGVIWPAFGSRNLGFATNPLNTSATGPYALGISADNTLTIEIGYFNNTLTGTYPIYWVLYRDYALT